MVRWGGLAAAASSVMFVVSGILTLIAPQGAASSFGAYVLEVVIVVAFALVMIAIAGCMPRRIAAGGTGGSGQRAPC